LQFELQMTGSFIEKLFCKARDLSLGHAFSLLDVLKGMISCL